MNGSAAEADCRTTRERLDAYIDRELPADTRQSVAAHLEACPSCADEANVRTMLKARVRTAAGTQVAPPELAVKIRERISDRSRRSWWAPVAGGGFRWAAAGAGIAIFALFLWVGRPERLPAIGDRPAQNSYIQRISAKLTRVFRPGLSDHLHCAVFRRYPSNPPALATMLADLGPYRELLPAVQAVVPKSWRVEMAHQCTYMGRKYIHVVVRNGSRLMSLVITRREAGESLSGLVPAVVVNGTAVYEATAAEYRIAAFETGSYLVYAVSSGGSEGAVQLARSVLPDMCRLFGGNL